MARRYLSSRGVVLTPTRLSCSDNGLGSISDLELVEDIGEVVAHRLGTEHQALRNLNVVTPLGQQSEYFTLALGQFGKRLRWYCRCARWRKVTNQAFRNGRAEDRLAATDGFDGAQRLLLVGPFEQVTTRPGTHGGKDRVVVLVHRHDQNADVRAGM